MVYDCQYALGYLLVVGNPAVDQNQLLLTRYQVFLLSINKLGLYVTLRYDSLSCPGSLDRYMFPIQILQATTKVKCRTFLHFERIHGFDKSETSVVTDSIEFDSAEDLLSVAVADLIELDLDRAEDLLFNTDGG